MATHSFIVKRRRPKGEARKNEGYSVLAAPLLDDTEIKTGALASAQALQGG
jgi:hypothetical protein